MFNKEEIAKFNNQSMGEEIANAISHGVGTLLAIAGTAVAIVYSCLTGDAMSTVSAALYGAGLILLYLSSTLYHSLTNIKAKRIFQIFDHCSIFILILCSYIPISLALLRGTLGWVLFGVNAACTIVGIVLNSIDVKKFQKISMVIYILMGWSVIFVAYPVLSKIPLPGIILLVAGGLSYTGGIFFFRMKKPRYMHYIWHLFVLAGSIFHYFAFLFYALPVR
ncbi:MAG: hemolysin III family protein [Clostridia bacterium]|nr:hemolysin III family protein [Clostridia bacterium]